MVDRSKRLAGSVPDRRLLEKSTNSSRSNGWKASRIVPVICVPLMAIMTRKNQTNSEFRCSRKDDNTNIRNKVMYLPRLDKRDKTAGSVPVKPLSPMRNAVKSSSSPILGEMVPVKLFSSKRRSVSKRLFQKASGIWPVMSLRCT